MVDKSWGQRSPVTSDVLPPRGDTLAARLDARAAARAQLAEEREALRRSRREANEALAVHDPHAAAAQRRRGSGRKDIVREQRDTSGYRMVADAARIRALAARGASAESLADVLGLPIETIREAIEGAG